MAKHNIHQYKKVTQNPSGRTIWRCMIVNCSHYITPELIIGKYSICPQCQQEFVMNKAATMYQFPKCEDCRSKRKLTGAVARLVEQSKTSVSTPPKELTNVAADILKKFNIG